MDKHQNNCNEILGWGNISMYGKWLYYELTICNESCYIFMTFSKSNKGNHFVKIQVIFTELGVINCSM